MIQLIIYNILITLFKKESPGILPGLSAFINDKNLMCKLYTKYENQSGKFSRNYSFKI